jgi:hypothetical protein
LETRQGDPTKEYNSSLLHINIHQTQRGESSILFIREAIINLELNLGYTSMYSKHHFEEEPYDIIPDHS